MPDSDAAETGPPRIARLWLQLLRLLQPQRSRSGVHCHSRRLMPLRCRRRRMRRPSQCMTREGSTATPPQAPSEPRRSRCHQVLLLPSQHCARRRPSASSHPRKDKGMNPNASAFRPSASPESSVQRVGNAAFTRTFSRPASSQLNVRDPMLPQVGHSGHSTHGGTN